MSKNYLNSQLQLPCGITLNNRLVKSAMTERISNRQLEPTEAHERLYRKWSETGAGLLITGNVMIDRTHLESAGNICFDDEAMLPKLRRWAKAGKENGNHIWVQISHAGRQTNLFNTLKPLAPSKVKLKKLGLFGKPTAMSEEDIHNAIQGFAKAAKLAQDAGFTGVQIHSAHGYLSSQFLSPKTNKRTDEWGGNIENRSRFLFTILREVRKVVGENFPISVKLNSADFQKGGFTEEDSLKVIKMLNHEKLDLLEISGGTYEKVAFFLMNEDKANVKESTKAREAYFIDFAKKVKSVTHTPLLITGGFRSFDFCNNVIENGELDLVGMARPFITNLKDIPGFLNGEVQTLDNLVLRTGIKQLEDAAEAGFYAKQLIQIANNKKPDFKISPLSSSIFFVSHEINKALQNKF